MEIKYWTTSRLQSRYVWTAVPRPSTLAYVKHRSLYDTNREVTFESILTFTNAFANTCLFFYSAAIFQARPEAFLSTTVGPSALNNIV